MTDVGLGELIVRMVVSLAIVLAIVLVAYAFLRRRQHGGGSFGRAPMTRRATGTGAGRSRRTTARNTGGRRGLRIVGRVGVSRTSSIVAVQFAERVLLVGASEQTGPAVLAELSVDDWERATEASQESVPLATGGTTTARPGILDALREATIRRG
jgi:flagellar biogenesis protein FliO